MKRVYFFTIMLLSTVACVDRGSNNKDDGNPDDTYTSEASDSTQIRDNDDFQEAFTSSPYFSEWDSNSDNTIDQDEFFNNHFTIADKNNDDALNEQEWQKAISTFFGSEGDQLYGDFSEWDSNGDGSVQAEEFDTYLNDKKYFAEWDSNGDGQLEEKEFSEEVFHKWDTDGNGVVEAEEFTEWNNKVDEGI